MLNKTLASREDLEGAHPASITSKIEFDAQEYRQRILALKKVH